MGDIASRFVRDLTAVDREALADLSAQPSPAVAMRARVVLLSAGGTPIGDIMRRLELSRPTVTTWLGRFERHGPAGLLTRARPGRPPMLTAAIQRRIGVVASARPHDVGRPGATWTLRGLREYLVASGCVPRLSVESLRTALRRWDVTLKTVRRGTTRKGTTMIPGAFEYHAPASLAEAAGLLARLGDEAKILSGGQSLIPLMKLRLARPSHVVDINGIPGLAYIKESDGFLRIGALTRESDLEASDLVRTRYPLLYDTCRVIADPLVRNLATVGGNLAHGDPANDHPATMIALGAEVVAVGKKGERRLPIATFFTGPFATALAADEILTEVRVPIPPARSGGAYQKLERKVGDFATAAVAAQVTLNAKGAFEKVGLALTNVGLTPIRATKAESVLINKPAEEAVVKQAAQLAAEQSQPSADLRGSVEYKRDLVRVLTARALHHAIERARAAR